MKKFTLFVIALFVISVPLWWIRANTRRAEKYVIPSGYVGWVRVKYNSVGAPPLPLENGYLLLVIPASGVLKTSSLMGDGWGTDEYYQIDKRGQRIRLDISNKEEQQPAIRGGSTNGSQYKFFIGSEKQSFSMPSS